MNIATADLAGVPASREPTAPDLAARMADEIAAAVTRRETELGHPMSGIERAAARES